MNYQNALKGIKKIYISQFIAIITTLMTGLTSIIIDLFSRNGFDLDNHFFVPMVTLSAALGLLSIAGLIAMVTLSVAGYIQASKDEPEFKKAMICCLTSGILVLAGMLFQIPNGTIYTILTSAAAVVEMFVIVFGVNAVMLISEKYERTDISKKGNNLLKIIVFTYIITAINFLIIRIFELSENANTVSYIINIFNVIINVTQYILYIRYLKTASKMLTEN